MPTKATTKKRTSTKKNAPASVPVRREVGAMACALLAVFCFLGLAGVKALFLNFLTNALQRFIGFGAYVMPVALAVAAFILLFHRGRPIKLRVWCALLMPIWIGGMLYLWISDLPKFDLQIFIALWESGGVISGFLALLFKTLFSGIGAGILFIIGLIILAVIVLRVDVVGVVDAIRDHKPPEYEPRPEPVKPVTLEKPKPRVRRSDFDIPIDNEPVLKKRSEEPPESEQNPEPKPESIPEPPVAQPEPAPWENEKPEHSEDTDTLPDGFTSLGNYEFGKPLPPPVQSKPTLRPIPVPPPVSAPAPKPATKPDSTNGLRPPKESPRYVFPPLSLLPGSSVTNMADFGNETRDTSTRLCEAILSFGIDASLVNVVRGPSVARYEFEIAQGMTLNKLTNRADDIALALGADSVRIAPVPGKAGTVGIEVPNKLINTVYLRDVLESEEFSTAQSRLAFALGKDIGGSSVVGDIFRLTHLLVAGTTGSGKSVCVNSLIISLLYKASPDEVKLILIDPKMVELDVYNGIPHLLVPVVTDPKKASSALQWAVFEMEKRYRMMQERGVRDIFAYNQAIADEDLPKVPQMVIIIDELADLMMVAGKEVEDSVIRIAQKARAAGMHLVVATQRPSADVITGLMKSNIPSRIAFTVASGTDSRIILDTTGAEKLIGKGDMLYAPLGSKVSRVQGCYVHEKEVKAVVEFIKKNSSESYDPEVQERINRPPEEGKKGAVSYDDGDSGSDPVLNQAMDIILEVGQASTSMLQRRLKLGYARAARVVDQLEERGLLGPSEGSKPRAILVSYEQWQGIKERNG